MSMSSVTRFKKLKDFLTIILLRSSDYFQGDAISADRKDKYLVATLIEIVRDLRVTSWPSL